MVVNVDIEYCGTCGYLDKFEEMKRFLEQNSQAKITGTEGRRASFEVKINDTLVHSKLSTLAFPDYEDVSNIVTEVASGQQVRTNCKQQPINTCNIM